MKTLGIIGYGWLGTHLANAFKDEYAILGTTRSLEKLKGIQAVEADFTQPQFLQADFNAADIVFISTNFPKEEIGQWLANLKTFLGNYKNQLFLCSSTGIYPDFEMEFTENSVDDSELNKDILNVESVIKEAYPQVNILRLGGLMGDERYLSKWFVNRPLPKPGARINYIHYQDIVGVVKALVNSCAQSKTYNVVAPEHPRKNEVYEAQTSVFVEGEDYNRIISPNKLIKEIGYTFVYPNPVEFPFVKS